MSTGMRDTLVGGVVAAAMTLLGPIAPGADPQAAAGSSTGIAPALARFVSCEQLRQWYVDQSIGQIGPDGWTVTASMLLGGGTTNLSAARDSASTPVENGATGTNIQEAGVDEPDVAKTDGQIVVRLQGQMIVITDVSGEAPRKLATWSLPGGTNTEGLLLVAGHVIVATQLSATAEQVFPGASAGMTTDVYDLDVTDPTDPTLAAHTTWSGQSLSLRQYGDTVRLVTTTGLPDLPFVAPGRGITQAEAIARNQAIVRSAPIERWLPSVRRSVGQVRAVDCDRIYHPSTSERGRWSQTTLGVYTLRPGVEAPVAAVALTGAGEAVYSSADRLYVWSTDWQLPMRINSTTRSLIRPVVAPRTQLHAFAIDGEDTVYLASGSIEGEVRDRWSFDEHEGLLRVAVAFPRRLTPRRLDSVAPDSASGDHGVVVLEEQGDQLVRVGEVRGLGPAEVIQSVRWFDDLAVLVTFRQTDPLYTVDLSDPSDPRALGELKLPGFSSYLHPIGGGRLLGLGADSGPAGSVTGAKVAVFDLSDTSRPLELDTASFGLETSLTAGFDSRAFTWLTISDRAGTAITQLDNDLGSRLVKIEVAADGSLTTSELPNIGGQQLRAFPLPDGRVALVGDRVALRDGP